MDKGPPVTTACRHAVEKACRTAVAKINKKLDGPESDSVLYNLSPLTERDDGENLNIYTVFQTRYPLWNTYNVARQAYYILEWFDVAVVLEHEARGRPLSTRRFIKPPCMLDILCDIAETLPYNYELIAEIVTTSAHLINNKSRTDFALFAFLVGNRCGIFLELVRVQQIRTMIFAELFDYYVPLLNVLEQTNCKILTAEFVEMVGNTGTKLRDIVKKHPKELNRFVGLLENPKDISLILDHMIDYEVDDHKWLTREHINHYVKFDIVPDTLQKLVCMVNRRHLPNDRPRHFAAQCVNALRDIEGMAAIDYDIYWRVNVLMDEAGFVHEAGFEHDREEIYLEIARHLVSTQREKALSKITNILYGAITNQHVDLVMYIMETMRDHLQIGELTYQAYITMNDIVGDFTKKIDYIGCFANYGPEKRCKIGKILTAFTCDPKYSYYTEKYATIFNKLLRAMIIFKLIAPHYNLD